MKLFATAAELTKAQESLGAMEVRATTAEAAAKDFEAQLIDAKAEAGALGAKLQAAQSALAETNTKLVQASEQIAAKDAEIANAKAGIGKQVAAQAAATVAGLGHQVVPITVASSSNGTIREQYAAMKPGPERRAFRQKHIAQLSAELN